MKQDGKCFLGVHKYELIEKVEVKDQKGQETIGINFVSRCSNCGKICTVFVPTNTEYLTFNRR